MRGWVFAATVAVVVGGGGIQSVLAQPSTASSSTISPARLALAQKVVDATGVEANASKIMDAALGPMLSGLRAGNNPEMSAYLGQLMRTEIGDMINNILPLYAGIYARTFNDQQLLDLLTFYQSPTGRMLAAKTGDLARESALAVQPLIPRMQRDMTTKLFDHICTMQHCTAEQRQKIMTAKEAILSKIDLSAAHPAS